MAKNKKLCRDCQRRPISYTHSDTGKKMAHGVCDMCWEDRVRRGSGKGGNTNRRSQDQQENTYETKFGTGHG